jgi:enoyl-[acyl-carrier-protein] reductase (NADH)
VVAINYLGPAHVCSAFLPGMEVAAPVLFFASDAVSFITGQVISVSGGLTMAG